MLRAELSVPAYLCAAFAQSVEVLIGGRILAGARESFLVGDQWAYTAGIIAVLIGGVIVFALFPKKDEEEALLAQYQAEDAKALAAVQQSAAVKSGVPATATA